MIRMLMLALALSACSSKPEPEPAPEAAPAPVEETVYLFSMEMRFPDDSRSGMRVLPDGTQELKSRGSDKYRAGQPLTEEQLKALKAALSADAVGQLKPVELNARTGGSDAPRATWKLLHDGDVVTVTMEKFGGLPPKAVADVQAAIRNAPSKGLASTWLWTDAEGNQHTQELECAPHERNELRIPFHILQTSDHPKLEAGGTGATLYRLRFGSDDRPFVTTVSADGVLTRTSPSADPTHMQLPAETMEQLRAAFEKADWNALEEACAD